MDLRFLDDVLRGQNPAIVEAAKRAAIKYGGRVDRDGARVVSACWSKRLSIDSGDTTDQTAIKTAHPFLVTHVFGRFRSDDATDDATMCGLKLLQPNGAGYLLGTASEVLNLSVLSDTDVPFPVVNPWLFTPNEELTLEASQIDTLAGNVTITIGFGGVYLVGWDGR